VNIPLGGDNKKPEATNHHAQTGADGRNIADTSPNRPPDAGRSNRTDNNNYQWRTRLHNFIYEAKITDWLLAVFTLGLVIYTAKLVHVASQQTKILTTTDVAVTNTAKAAKDANTLNETALRPWADFALIEPSAGFAVKGDTVTVGIRYSLKNTGRLPAIRTNVTFEMVPLEYYGPMIDLTPTPIVTDRQLSVCKKSEFDIGNTIFPGQSMAKPYIVSVEASQKKFRDMVNEGKQIYVVLVTACVGYQLAITGNYGHTGASLIVARGTNSNVLPLNLLADGTTKLEETINLRLPLEVAD
jgi:hypothetical protein